MTVASAVSRTTYTSNGSATIYPYTFRIIAATDLRVMTRSATTGAETVLSYPSQYSVSGVGNPTGGSITLASAVTAGDTLLIRRVRPLTQQTSFRSQGSFFPESHEDALDTLTMITQQLQDQVDRSFHVAETVNPGVVALFPLPAANQLIGWRSDATALENKTIVSTGVALPSDGRTVSSLTAYLANNAVFNIKDFGAIGDGTSHPLSSSFASLAAAQAVYPFVTSLTQELDWAALQKAVNVFSGSGWNGVAWGSPSRSGSVICPEGTYLLSTTLTYNGAAGFSIILQGTAGAALGTSGTTFQWNGAAGGIMFYAQGMCRSLVQDITFDGAQPGKNVLYCIQVDGKNTTQVGSPGSQTDTFQRVMCRVGTFANCAAFAFAHVGSNDQVDTMTVRDCFVQGASSTTSTGILIMGGGNVTHFTVEGGEYISLGYVMQAGSIMGLAVDHVLCLLSTVADFAFTAALQAVFTHVHSEQAVSAQFVTVGAAGGPGTINLNTCSWNGVAPANDVIVSAGTCAVIVQGGQYINTRTGTSIPKFQVGNPRSGPSGNNLGGIHSRGAFYLNADNTSALWPFADQAGNRLAVSLPGVAGTYYDLYAMGASFSSFGDNGGTLATMIPLVSQDSAAGSRNFTTLRSQPNTALTDVSAIAAIGLRKGDAIKFKVETGGPFDADVNGLSKDSSDRIVVGGTGGASTPKLTISTAVGKVIPGATSLSLRNNADSADNLLIVDAGDVTARATMTATGYKVGANQVLTSRQAAIPDTSGATLANVEIEVNKLKAMLRLHGLIS